jgi:hypothetical protein
MTNRDDTADPTAQPSIPIFPLTAFRQRVDAMDIESLQKLAARAGKIRNNLGDTPPVGFENRYYRIIQACNYILAALAGKQFAPSEGIAAGLAQGDTLITETP